MKFPTVIPERVSISLLYEYLELTAMNQDAKLDALISFSQNSGLLFTFHQGVNAIPAEIPIGNIGDEAGDFTEFKPARDEDIQYIETAKSFKLKHYNIQQGKPFTYISSFKESGVPFNIINADKSDIGVFDIDLAHVYVKKSDCNNFIMSLNLPPLDPKNAKSRTSIKKEEKQERIIAILVNLLAKESVKAKSNQYIKGDKNINTRAISGKIVELAAEHKINDGLTSDSSLATEINAILNQYKNLKNI